MKKVTKTSCIVLAIMALALFSSGCSVRALSERKTLDITKEVPFKDVVEKAEKACEQIGLDVSARGLDPEIYGKEAVAEGELIMCMKPMSLFNPFSKSRFLKIILKEENGVLRKVSVEGSLGGVGGSKSGLQSLIDKYLNALKSLGIE